MYIDILCLHFYNVYIIMHNYVQLQKEHVSFIKVFEYCLLKIFLKDYIIYYFHV